MADDLGGVREGDVRTLTITLRCVGPFAHQHSTAPGFEVIGIEASVRERVRSA